MDAGLSGAAVAVLTGDERLEIVQNNTAIAQSAPVRPIACDHRHPVLDNEKRILRTVAVLDKKAISLCDMNYLRKSNPELPSNTQLHSARKKLHEDINKALDIQLVNCAGDIGWVVSPGLLLTWLTKSTNRDFSEHATINICLQGDGRSIGRKHGSTILSFIILEEGRRVTQVNHLYPLAIVGCKEAHGKFKHVMNVLRPMLLKVKEDGLTDTHGRRHDVHFYLCADWKFIQVMRGLPNASSNRDFCLFCTATREQRRDCERTWPIDPQRLSSAKEDLFEFVSLYDTIPDCLHAMLRVTDKLSKLTFGMFCCVCFVGGRGGWEQLCSLASVTYLYGS